MIILVASVSAQLLNATDVKHCFYNALVLNALPVPLLRQVYFFLFLRYVFSRSFSVRFLGGLGGASGGPGVDFGAIWRHLGVIFVTF